MSIKRFPAYLRDAQEEVEGYAKGFGLDFFTILYEVLDYKTMNEVAAYGGFPTRYPHWRFGMDYEQLSKSYEWGMSKIYEMVINTNPAYAYLLEGNSLTDQKMVMAHVCGHVDFFKNNYFFSKTNRKMIDGMANHAAMTVATIVAMTASSNTATAAPVTTSRSPTHPRRSRHLPAPSSAEAASSRASCVASAKS